MVDKKQSDAILNSVDTSEDSRRYPTEFVTASGVRFQIKPVAASAISDAQSRHKQPKVPKWYNDDRQREEDNPVHPDYLADMATWREEQGEIMLRVMLLLGTKVLDVPGSVEPPEGTNWSQTLTEAGVQVAESGNARYVDWMRFYILNDDQEAVDLMQAIQRAGKKIPEGAVEVAAESFRNN